MRKYFFFKVYKKGERWVIKSLNFRDRMRVKGL